MDKVRALQWTLYRCAKQEPERRFHALYGHLHRMGVLWPACHTWTATPGSHLLSARATDAEGHTQPLDQPWNRGGFANNLVQRVPVLCLDPDSDQDQDQDDVS